MNIGFLLIGTMWWVVQLKPFEQDVAIDIYCQDHITVTEFKRAGTMQFPYRMGECPVTPVMKFRQKGNE